ncbi:MAG: TRAP transporter substrate-binding protein [Burkholderiaceae bacterium]|nr:TRAP transporter substrate-binding protein [Burkholderiaceae bacterium]
MNRRVIPSLVALVAGCAIASSPMAAPKELKFSVYMSETHWLVRDVFKPFAADVEKLSKGEVKVKVMAGGVLGGAKEQLGLAEKGIADIAFVIPSYTRNRFLYTEAGLLPFAFDSAEQATNAMSSLRGKYLNAEFDTVKLLMVGTTSPSALVTTVPVNSLADMKGLNLRGAGGAQTAMLKAVGANVVSMPVSDAYLAFQRGALQGTIIPLASAPGYKFQEVVKYVNPMNFSVTMTALVANPNTWKSLSPAQQAAIEKAADQARIHQGKGFDREDATGLQILVKAGSKQTRLPAADKAKLSELAKPMWAKWEQTAKGRGLKADQFMTDLRAAIAANPAK